jgi:hypothetical protein
MPIPTCDYVISPRDEHNRVIRSHAVTLVICNRPASFLYGTYGVCHDHRHDVLEGDDTVDVLTPIPPYVGMPATVCYYTDRHPGTVVYVSPKGNKVVVRENEARRKDANGMSDEQDWEILPTLTEKEHVFFRKDGGEFGARSKRLSLGVQRKYFDYSF